MQVARDRHHVLDAVAGEVPQQVGAVAGEAVPGIAVDHVLGVVGRGRQGPQVQPQAAEHDLVAPDLPGGGAVFERLLPPVGLGCAQHGRRAPQGLGLEGLELCQHGLLHEVARADGITAVDRVVPLGLGDDRLGHEVVVAVQTLVGHHQVGEVAELEVAVDAQVGVGRVGAVERHVAKVDRHVFQPGLAGRAAARGFLLVFVGVGLVVLPAVVAELMVVPGGDQGELGMQRLQPRIAAVGAVERAVVGQRGGVDGAVGQLGAVGQADARVRRLGRAGLEGRTHGFVDVVAQVHDEVQVGLGGQQVHRGPVVHAPVLAGEPGEAQLRHGRARSRRGLAGADCAEVVAGHEAVVQRRGRGQARDLGAHGEVVGGAGGERYVGQQCVKPRALGHLQPHRHIADGTVCAHATAPEHQARLARVAAGHALRELVAARGLVISATAGAERRGGDDEETGAGEEAAAVH